jgi:hypothetical protein
LRRHQDDQPTIGLILCKERNRTIVEYTLRDTRKPIGVAAYQLRRGIAQGVGIDPLHAADHLFYIGLRHLLVADEVTTHLVENLVRPDGRIQRAAVKVRVEKQVAEVQRIKDVGIQDGGEHG